MIRLGTLLLFYRRNLKTQPLRELMAVLGVAAGVALLFAVQVANGSITASLERVVKGIAGNATLEVAARGPQGFDQGVAEQIAATPGVKAAAPVLEQQVVVVGSKGSQALMLVGSDERLAGLGGTLVSRLERYAAASRRGLIELTEPVAKEIGAPQGSLIAVHTGQRVARVAVAGAVPNAQLGPLAESPVGATPLSVLQGLTGLSGRVTRVLVVPQSGQEELVRRSLSARLGATLNVRSVQSEPRLLANAARPQTQLTALFSAISLVVGIIIAYNALLLASGERRAFIVYLVELGTPNSTIVASLIFDALILGLAGCVLGVIMGDVISHLAFHGPPAYLKAAFPIGDQRIFGIGTVLLAVGAGMLAALASAVFPAIAALRGDASDPGSARSARVGARRRTDRVAFAVGVTVCVVSVLAAIVSPAVSVVALVGLVCGLVACTPLAVRQALDLADRASHRTNDPSARLSVGELRVSPPRSIALAATGTVAVFLTVLIGGAVANIEQGIRTGARDTGAGADVWIRAGGPENVYATQPFEGAAIEHRLAALPEVSGVLPYRASFVDLPDRRILVSGVPPRAADPIAPTQLINGSLRVADQRLRESGWAAMTQQLASERNIGLGGRFSLPTPSGIASFRLAATVSNYGWLPGTVLMSAADYTRLWGATPVTRLGVTLRPGVSPQAGKLAVERALPAGSALTVQTNAQRTAQVSTVLGSTLSRLNDTALVVLIGAVVSVVALMVGAVWQRRGRLDTLMSMGMSFGQLSRLVFYESGLLLLAGCVVGMVSGLIGQRLIDGWLHHTTGSPVHFAAAWQTGVRALLLAAAIALATSIIAVVRTAGFDPRGAFSTE
jgi:putative ABC transport system permease protein